MAEKKKTPAFITQTVYDQRLIRLIYPLIFIIYTIQQDVKKFNLPIYKIFGKKIEKNTQVDENYCISL